MYVTPPLTGFTLVIFNGGAVIKTKIMPLPEDQKVRQYIHSSRYQRHNLGRMVNQARSVVLSMLTSDKMKVVELIDYKAYLMSKS